MFKKLLGKKVAVPFNPFCRFKNTEKHRPPACEASILTTNPSVRTLPLESVQKVYHSIWALWEEKTPKRTELACLCFFKHPYYCKISKKWRGKTLKLFRKKDSRCRKKLKERPFSLAQYCMLRWKKEQLLWSSSLNQIVQFDILKFRRKELFWSFHVDWTSRERPKSAPYLRLKNSKRTSKCQSIGELGTLLWKKSGVFNIHSVGKYKKNEVGPFGGIFFKKSLTEPKILWVEPFGPVEFLRWCKNTSQAFEKVKVLREQEFMIRENC